MRPCPNEVSYARVPTIRGEPRKTSVQVALSAIDWPPYVMHVDYELGIDATGGDAIRVRVVLADGRWKLDALSGLQARVEHQLATKCLQFLPYVRFDTQPERADVAGQLPSRHDGS